VIRLQIQHGKARPLGYDQNNLVMVEFTDELQKNYEFARNEMLQSGIVESITRSNQAIYQNYYDEFVEWEGKATSDKVKFAYLSTDHDYVKTNRLTILEGRDFSRERPTDSSAVLINQTAAKLMGYKDPVGKTLRFRDREWPIIGVVEDAIMDSPFEPVDPLFIGMLGGYHQKLTLRLRQSTDLPADLSALEVILKKANPANAPEIMFADENFAEKYRSIELIGTLSNLFATLAISLTALGVLGLAAYTAEQRTKEMAIRKILGADVINLLRLLAKDFVALVLIALAIAAPLSWWVMEIYLQNYSYRINVPWWALPATAISLLAITLLIVIAQVAKAAAGNMIDHLKSE